MGDPLTDEERREAKRRLHDRYNIPSPECLIESEGYRLRAEREVEDERRVRHQMSALYHSTMDERDRLREGRDRMATEIADACAEVGRLRAALEQVVEALCMSDENAPHALGVARRALSRDADKGTP